MKYFNPNCSIPSWFVKTSIVFLPMVLIFYMSSCKKERKEKEILIIGPFSEITYHSAEIRVEALSFEHLLSAGICYGTASNPTYNDLKVKYDSGDFFAYSLTLDELLSNTTYHIRAFAKKQESEEIIYGSDVKFTTLPIDTIKIFNPDLTYGTVSDIDGNTYKTIQIGTQLWMAENLKVTKYRDGSSIQNIKDKYTWSVDTIGAYCTYDNNLYGATFGYLYNYYTVADKRNLCPIGWHVPTDSEWTILTTYLGGEIFAGSKLKETGMTHWQSPNTDATNETGFTALPGGFLDGFYSYYGFNGIGTLGVWWSSTMSSNLTSLTANLYYYDSGFIVGGYQSHLLYDGISVRCVKNN
jgi:uncharacterized protein (TIGR02145 family)